MFALDGLVIYVLVGLNFVVSFFVALLVLGAYHEIRQLKQGAENQNSLPVPSRLLKGETFTSDLGIKIPARTFLLFLSYSCSGCFDICRRLQKIDLGDWSLFITVADKPLTANQLEEVVRNLPPGVPPERVSLGSDLPIPEYATILHDPERRWFRELGITATPTALALVGNRVVDQQVAPGLVWFTDLPEQRRSRGKEMRLSTAKVHTSPTT